MKFVFIDKTEYEMGVIKDILTSYNIHYKVRTDRDYGFFGSSCFYNIEIDVTPEFYEYLCKEIDNKLSPIELLEDCYDLPDAEKPVKIRKQRKSKYTKRILDMEQPYLPNIHNLFEKMLNNSLGIDKSSMGDKNNVVKFDQLSIQEQQMLKEQIPEHILRSKDCVIMRTQWGLQVYVGVEDD